MEWNELTHKVGPTTGTTYYESGKLPQDGQLCEIVTKYPDEGPVVARYTTGTDIWDRGFEKGFRLYHLSEVEKWRLYEE